MATLYDPRTHQYVDQKGSSTHQNIQKGINLLNSVFEGLLPEGYKNAVRGASNRGAATKKVNLGDVLGATGNLLGGIGQETLKIPGNLATQLIGKPIAQARQATGGPGEISLPGNDKLLTLLGLQKHTPSYTESAKQFAPVAEQAGYSKETSQNIGLGQEAVNTLLSVLMAKGGIEAIKGSGAVPKVSTTETAVEPNPLNPNMLVPKGAEIPIPEATKANLRATGTINNADSPINLKGILKDESGGINFGAEVGGGPKVPEAPKTSNLREELKPQQAVEESFKENILTPQKPIDRIVDSNLKSGRAALSKTESGKTLSRAIDFTENQANIDTGQTLFKLKKIEAQGFSEAEKANVRAVLEGREAPSSPKTAQAADFLRKDVYDKRQTNAKAVGLQTPYLKDYTPQLPKEPGMFNTPAGRDRLIKHLVSSGQARDTVEAQILIEQGGFGKSGVRRFGPLDYQRRVTLPDEMKITDPFKQAEAYVHGADKRIAQSGVFGPEGGKLNHLIEGVAREGGDAQFAKEMVDRFTGNVPDTTLSQGIDAISKPITTFEAVTKLGMAGIRNIPQGPLNSAFRHGTLNMLKAFNKVFTKEGQAFAEQTGVLVKDAMRQSLQQQTGTKLGTTATDITAPGLRVIEKFNRKLNTLAGREEALTEFNKLKKNPTSKVQIERLKRLGVDDVDGGISGALKRGELTERQQLTAGGEGSAQGQFGQRFTRVPLSFHSPAGKVLFQFKNFPAEMTDLIVKQIKDEVLKNGNMEPLLLLATAYPAAGEVINSSIAFLRGRKRTDNVAQRYLEDAVGAGALGMFADLVTAAGYGTESLAKFALGPAVGDALTLGGNVGELTKGVGEAITTGGDVLETAKSKSKPLERQLLGAVPLVGPTLRNTFLPSQSLTAERNQQPSISGNAPKPRTTSLPKVKPRAPIPVKRPIRRP